MADRPKGYISHRTPHRVRLRIPSKRRDRAFFADLQRHLSDNPEIEHVDVNPATGSALIHTFGNSARLIETTRRSGLIDLVESLTEEPF
jgi:hypothetical protein